MNAERIDVRVTPAWLRFTILAGVVFVVLASSYLTADVRKREDARQLAELEQAMQRSNAETRCNKINGVRSYDGMGLYLGCNLPGVR